MSSPLRGFALSVLSACWFVLPLRADAQAAPAVEPAASSEPAVSEPTPAPVTVLAPAPGPTVYSAPIYEAPLLFPLGRQRRRGKMFLVLGSAMFAGGYVGSVLSFALSSDVVDVRVVVPLAGPWIAMVASDFDRFDIPGQAILNLYVLGFMGVVQATGVALAIVGIVKRTRVPREHALSRFHFDAAPLPGGGYSSVRVRF